jgi:hypothetical protein
MLRAPAGVIGAFSGLVLAAIATSAGAQTVVEEPSAYVVAVSDVTAEVGEPALMRAEARDGSEFSSTTTGVAFEHKMVPATVDEDSLVFEVPLHTTKPANTRSTGSFASVT